jgi:RNA polymerase-binding transcription factor DksA
MNDARPAALTPDQLVRLEDALRARQRELRAAVASHLRTQDDPRLVGLRNRMEETDDWAAADAMAAQDIVLVSRELAELSSVEDALARMVSGSYGECADCAAAIAFERLSAYPMARRCIRCQEAAERQQALRK